MHDKRSICPLPALLLAACLALAGAPAWSQAAGGDAQPVLQVETGSHSAFVRRIDVAQDRNLAVTASDDKTARVWDLRTGELRQILRPPVGGGELGRLYGVAIHPTDDVVAIGGNTGNGVGQHRILLFSMSTGQPLAAFDARGGDAQPVLQVETGSHSAFVGGLVGGFGEAARAAYHVVLMPSSADAAPVARQDGRRPLVLPSSSATAGTFLTAAPANW